MCCHCKKIIKEDHKIVNMLSFMENFFIGKKKFLLKKLFFILALVIHIKLIML